MYHKVKTQYFYNSNLDDHFGGDVMSNDQNISHVGSSSNPTKAMNCPDQRRIVSSSKASYSPGYGVRHHGRKHPAVEANVNEYINNRQAKQTDKPRASSKSNAITSQACYVRTGSDASSGSLQFQRPTADQELQMTRPKTKVTFDDSAVCREIGMSNVHVATCTTSTNDRSTNVVAVPIAKHSVVRDSDVIAVKRRQGDRGNVSNKPAPNLERTVVERKLGGHPSYALVSSQNGTDIVTLIDNGNMHVDENKVSSMPPPDRVSSEAPVGVKCTDEKHGQDNDISNRLTSNEECVDITVIDSEWKHRQNNETTGVPPPGQGGGASITNIIYTKDKRENDNMTICISPPSAKNTSTVINIEDRNYHKHETSNKTPSNPDVDKIVILLDTESKNGHTNETCNSLQRSLLGIESMVGVRDTESNHGCEGDTSCVQTSCIDTTINVVHTYGEHGRAMDNVNKQTPTQGGTDTICNQMHATRSQAHETDISNNVTPRQKCGAPSIVDDHCLTLTCIANTNVHVNEVINITSGCKTRESNLGNTSRFYMSNWSLHQEVLSVTPNISTKCSAGASDCEQKPEVDVLDVNAITLDQPPIEARQLMKQTCTAQQITREHQSSYVVHNQSQAAMTLCDPLYTDEYNYWFCSFLQQYSQLPSYSFQNYTRLWQPIGYTTMTDFHTQSDLFTLLMKAENYVNNTGKPMKRCMLLYRDKSVDYFYNIMMRQGGMMTTYMKNFHGDPKSPINGRLNGLFFSTNINRQTGMPPETSICGEQRLLISPVRILRKCPNVYFTDFYCVSNAHYVTLVMTKPGTPSDMLCQAYLIRMSLDNPNGICMVDTRAGYLAFIVTTGVWLHIMITEDVDLNREIYLGAMFHNVCRTGKDYFVDGIRVGRRKNPNCSICNINPSKQSMVLNAE